jgi:hypothetical protein
MVYPTRMARTGFMETIEGAAGDSDMDAPAALGKRVS